jgi:hypothetical protein
MLTDGLLAGDITVCSSELPPLLPPCFSLTETIVSVPLDHTAGKVPAPDEDVQGPGTPAIPLKRRVGRCRDGVGTMLMQIQTSGRGKTYAHPITLVSTM